ncbi:MAG TPA: hypothetical protein VF179_20680 [Thermoanaerobaculia bacterium]|nr:hypothetical protein [Thermoanaerobaculia bacterium]
MASGAFDVENPCTWCANRKHKGQAGPAFYYLEYGRWEFPFIAEANCENFSLIVRPGVAPPDKAAWTAARTIHNHRNRIGEIGREYQAQWQAFSVGEVPPVAGRVPSTGRVTYPSNKAPDEFFREVNSMRSDFFALKQELQGVTREFREEWGIRDSKLDSWLIQNSKILGHVAKQIDELESTRVPSRLAVISRWAFNNVLGNAAWESFRFVTSLVGEMLRR